MPSLSCCDSVKRKHTPHTSAQALQLLPKMAISGSLLMSRDLGIHSDYRYNNRPKGRIGKGSLLLFSFSQSSHALQQDAWTHHLLNRVRGPKIYLSSRCNVFRCRSFLVPSGGNGIPVLKTAATALMRSCNSLHGSPVVLQLVPAVGIIVFAAWGLGPLMRLTRTLFLHSIGSSNFTYRSKPSYQATTFEFCSIIIYGASLCILSIKVVFIQQAQKFVMETNDSNDARNMGFQFVGKAVYTAVWVAAVSLFMELLGFSTQKWLTAGGLGTVLLTLAGHIYKFPFERMIHATRPFVVNEWIQTKVEGYEVSGTVEHVGWWSPTIIRGDDREAIHIPNHKFTMNVVRNLSQKTHWRIKTYLAISHLDVNKINNIVADMRKVLAKNPQVEQQRLHRRVFLENINPENQSLMILVSCFVKTSRFEEYLCVKETIMLDLLRVISHHRARLATPIRTIQKIHTNADIDNVPIAGAAADNRPLLLIEPSYKINGDDKAKASTPSTSDSKTDVKGRSTTILDETKIDDKGKVSAASTTDSKTPNPGSVGPVQDSEKQNLKKTAPDGAKNVISVDKPPLISQEPSSVKTDTPFISHGKQDSARPAASPSVARPALEDNIVLGVALEGSKRTLPIEEEITPCTNAELRELAASWNGNGSTLVGVDNKDDQIPAKKGD
ncbi:hypothetical protein HYC85_008228 [Camellia sinensis]|uniref:Uncharacterized protein n=1 Tax=Camellia sinensis TaxID=4442 RepID=A0A7J7HR86_CAMSI|nr:hypothetical protein HYC85_008228 [Camellia sinensis]